jgi:hypothetical protein
MGGSFHNDRRLYQLHAALSFVRIIDRPMNGTNLNTYSFEYAGPSTLQFLSKVQDGDLVAAAANGFPSFASVAAGILQDWSTMSAGQRSDAWQLYRLVDVRRWAQVHQVTPPVDIPSADINAVQDGDLSATAKVGRSAFNNVAATVYGTWWTNLPVADANAFFGNYKEA